MYVTFVKIQGMIPLSGWLDIDNLTDEEIIEKIKHKEPEVLLKCLSYDVVRSWRPKND